ncbi:MAG: hypothetical protein IPO63_18455 [Bacteroidetes bacterium]|nr:hypothetical protein [Bacteroidota bacterium]
MAFLLYTISCGSKHVSIRKSANPEVAYFCPMDTMINEANPGQCTVCGMNLIKNPNYSGEEINTVVVTSTGDTLHE